jgi:hypothetical protein
MKIQIQRKPISSIKTSIGELMIFPIRCTDVEQLPSLSNCDFINAKPIDALKELFRLICFFPKDLIEGKYRPKNPALQNEDVEKLQSREIEKFAKELVEKDKSLSSMIVQNDLSEKKDDKKEQIRKDESYIEFAHRLIRRYCKENRERMEALEKKAFENFGYPYSLQKELEKQFQISKLFIEEAKKYTSIPEYTQYKSQIPESLYSNHGPESFSPEIPDMQTYIPETLEEVLERSSKPLYEKLQALDKSLAESKGFIGGTYETMVKVLGTLNKSTLSNQIFSISSLFVSLIILILTIYSIWSSGQSSKEFKQALQANTQNATENTLSLLRNLEVINDTLLISSETNKTLISQTEENIKKNDQNTNNEILKALQQQNDLFIGINDSLEKLILNYRQIP